MLVSSLLEIREPYTGGMLMRELLLNTTHGIECLFLWLVWYVFIGLCISCEHLLEDFFERSSLVFVSMARGMLRVREGFLNGNLNTEYQYLDV